VIRGQSAPGDWIDSSIAGEIGEERSRLRV
jgi:hypothetical protein